MNPPGRKIRVLIIDDSVVACKVLSETIAGDPGMEVAGTALSGPLALSQLYVWSPDLVILDLDMPGMDGLQTLAEIKKVRPKLPVLICSALTGSGNRHSVQALLGGATDFVTKPTQQARGSAGFDAFSRELLEKIKSICGIREKPLSAGAALAGMISSAPGPAGSASPIPSSAPAQNREPNPIRAGCEPEILAIGVSTGGPQALLEFVPRITEDFPAPIVIVQHMPPLFTKSLSDSLGKKARIKVEEGVDGRALEAGVAYIAPGGFHMQVVKRKGRFELALNTDPAVNSCRPAVDVLFRSVAEAYGSKVLAVVLTGMGQDGLAGAEAIRKSGGAIFVQDEASSVVWGMPGTIARAGFADKILSLQDLPPAVLAVFQRRR